MAACVLATGVTRLAGQAGPSSIFGETVEVRVVNLEVEVADPEGLPVTGLGLDDFQLEVDGGEVPIGYFTEIRGGIAVAAPAPGERSVTAVPSLMPGEPVGTNYLVFVDDYFAIERDRNRVLSALREDVTALTPEDRMAIVAWDGELTMLTSWTDSPRTLEHALKRAATRPAYGLVRRSELRLRGGDGSPRATMFGAPSGFPDQLDVSELSYALQLESQLERAVSAVSAVLRSFANPVGRKVLLLLSGGWPYDVGEYVSGRIEGVVRDHRLKLGARLYGPLVDSANQVGYSVFPVDVPGMVAGEVGEESVTSRGPGFDRGFRLVREGAQHLTLESIARATGGRALLNRQSVEALARASGATRNYYWIGFTPDWQGDDRRHAVAVTVRREGLRTRARAGYVDFSKRNELSAAVESVLLFGGGPGVRPLELTVGRPARAARNSMQVPITLTLPAAELAALPTELGMSAQVELRLAAIDERGARSDIPVLGVRFEFPEGVEPGARARYRTTVELRRLRNRLVVAVYDPLSGVLWSATVEVVP